MTVWDFLFVFFLATAAVIVICHPRRTRPAPAAMRPRLGQRAIGPRIEHIPQHLCPDCLDWWDDGGQPIRILCLVHDRPDPQDDLSLWDAELRKTRARLPWHRRILWEDQHQ